MSDYISREDSLKAIKEMFRKSDMPDEWQSGVVDAYRLIEQIPAADVRPVVLCRDCEHWEYDVIFADGWCRVKNQGNPNWFCADGKKREES